MPRITASSGAAGVEEGLWTSSRPPSSLSTMSVKVPPMSAAMRSAARGLATVDTLPRPP